MRKLPGLEKSGVARHCASTPLHRKAGSSRTRQLALAIGLILVISTSVGLDTTALASNVVTSFDGTYSCTETVTVQVTNIPAITKKGSCNFSVTNGRIGGGASGLILNSEGAAHLTVPADGLSFIVVVVFKLTSNGGATMAGVLSGHKTVGPVNIVLTGTMSADRTSGNTPKVSLPSATRGVPYKDFSFCPTPVKLNKICGFETGTTSSFSLPINEDVPFGDMSLLPKGMHLDFDSGILHGTPDASAKSGTYGIRICRHKSGETTEYCVDAIFMLN